VLRPTASQRLNAALQVLRPVLDIVEKRVDDVEVPAWCERRGWAAFLSSLGDEDLRRCEEQGLSIALEALPGAPADLRELARAVRSATALPSLQAQSLPLPEPWLRSVRARKREQLGLLLGALARMAAHAERIVDVGAGRGAFTRLAARHFQRAALGLELDAERVAAASARLVDDADDPRGEVAEFRASDVFRDGLELSARDLAVGLHACGELGDQLVRTAAEIGCDAALISCCLQKISQPARAPLSRAAGGTAFSRGILGLTNQTAQPDGVETSLEQTQSARKARYALWRLLRERGLELEPGAEMKGINRRRAHAGLRSLAESALGLRGLSAASDAEIAHYERAADAAFPVIRRLNLPRALLARLVEVSITLDRAAYFEERGFHSAVVILFQRAVTPRNLAIFASHAEERLPRPDSDR